MEKIVNRLRSDLNKALTAIEVLQAEVSDIRNGRVNYRTVPGEIIKLLMERGHTSELPEQAPADALLTSDLAESLAENAKLEELVAKLRVINARQDDKYKALQDRFASLSKNARETRNRLDAANQENLDLADKLEEALQELSATLSRQTDLYAEIGILMAERDNLRSMLESKARSLFTSMP